MNVSIKLLLFFLFLSSIAIADPEFFGKEACIPGGGGPIQEYIILGISMAPAIRPHQSVSVDTNYYKDHQPKRGDVIAFRNPRRKDEVMIKRIIALPGERFEMKDGNIFISSREVVSTRLRPTQCSHLLAIPEMKDQSMNLVCNEENINGQAVVTFAYRNSMSKVRPTEIWTGSFYVMGDNREFSLDSRSFGAVPRDLVIGKVVEQP